MDKKASFKLFLESNDVLIVDKNPSSRTRLIKIMCDLGSKKHRIHSTGSLLQAEELISSKPIGLVLSDYTITGGSGFDLFKLIREKSPGNTKLCLVLVTANMSQTAVAKAAEEDVDSFIIKPYTIESIHESLTTSVLAKIQPSKYMLAISEGKSLIAFGEYDQAIELLEKAKKLHPQPSLALFYIGQANYLKQLVDQALGSYDRGISINKIHFKCLIGLYETFINEGLVDRAYEVIKTLTQYFPANPDRLTQIIRLAVITKNFQDMHLFYDIFTVIEERTEVIKNYIGAGLYISAKHYMLSNQPEDAFVLLDRIAVSCSEFTKYLRATISLLVSNGFGKEAEKFLSRFSPDTFNSEDYIVSDYLVTSQVLDNPQILIKKGIELYNKKIDDLQCLEVMVLAMEKFGYNEEKTLPFRNRIQTLVA